MYANTTQSPLGAIVLLVALVCLLLYVSRGRLHPFSAALGRTRMRSVAGGNAQTGLCVLAVAQLTVDVAKAGPSDPVRSEWISLWLVASALVLVVGLVIRSRFTQSAIGFAGIGSFFITTFFEQGPGAVVMYGVLVALLLVLLTFARGFAG